MLLIRSHRMDLIFPYLETILIMMMIIMTILFMVYLLMLMYDDVVRGSSIELV